MSDELREKVAALVADAMESGPIRKTEAWEQVHDDATDRIIALVRQDERRKVREQLLSDEAVADMFYEAITLAHGEGEALGASRFKNAQCPECARQKEDEDIVAYRREGRTPPVLAQHVVPMVGFGIADRKQLATEFAARAAIGLGETDTDHA